MKRLATEQIREHFNAQRTAHEESWAKSGLNTALENISLALQDLNNNGVSVSLEMMGTPSEQAFGMLEGGMTVPVSGILRIDNMHFLLSVATKHSGQACLKLCLSEFDIRFQGVKAKVKESDLRQSVRADIFDLKDDPEALVKFQKEIIRNSARNQVIDDHNIGGTLESGINRKKPALKPPLQKPANG